MFYLFKIKWALIMFCLPLKIESFTYFKLISNEIGRNPLIEVVHQCDWLTLLCVSKAHFITMLHHVYMMYIQIHSVYCLMKHFYRRMALINHVIKDVTKIEWTIFKLASRLIGWWWLDTTSVVRHVALLKETLNKEKGA